MRTRLFALLVAVCIVASTTWTATHPSRTAALRPAAGHASIVYGACQSDTCG
jgi:hypothetical protein